MSLAQRLLREDIESSAGIDAAQGAKEEVREEVSSEHRSTNSGSSGDANASEQDPRTPNSEETRLLFASEQAVSSGDANSSERDPRTPNSNGTRGDANSSDGDETALAEQAPHAQQSFDIGEPETVQASHAKILRKCRGLLKGKRREFKKLGEDVDKSLRSVQRAELTQKAAALANTGVQAAVQAALQAGLQSAVANDEEGSSMKNIAVMSVFSVSLNLLKDLHSLHANKKLVVHNKNISLLSHLCALISDLEDLVDNYKDDVGEVREFCRALCEVEKKHRTFMVQQKQV